MNKYKRFEKENIINQIIFSTIILFFIIIVSRVNLVEHFSADQASSEIAIEKVIIKNNKNYASSSNQKNSVIKEKTIEDLSFIFSRVNEIKYGLEPIVIKKGPGELYETYKIFEPGAILNVVGYNQSEYLKINISGQFFYIKNENLTENKNEVFKKINKKMYVKEYIQINTTKESNQIISLYKGTTVNVVGINEEGLVQLNIEEQIFTIKSELLSEEIVKTEPYMETNTEYGPVDYKTANIFDGVLALVPETEKNESNLYLLAQLIHCEAGGQTLSGKLAVGTVVANRMYDESMGKTTSEVIYRPSQFSPASKDSFESTIPNETDLEAARMVLYEGYRSFPAYVLYFQSLGDGAFNGHKTYLTAYDENKNYPQYFSYKNSDLEKYKK